MTAKVLIVLGSDSDLPTARMCLKALDDFGVEYDIRVCSAHRTPAAAHELASQAADLGFKVVIAMAGAAAHLAGVFAASTTLPVIGVPIESGALRGVDALYSTVQMPGGIPVACMAIGEAGARNAGVFAVQILAASDASLTKKLVAHKDRLAAEVAKKNAGLPARLRALETDSTK
ncbi:MAG: 5-(carboxyamino)imidazole ribonucleotide mutase [Planctomycetota bacterium]